MQQWLAFLQRQLGQDEEDKGMVKHFLHYKSNLLDIMSSVHLTNNSLHYTLSVQNKQLLQYLVLDQMGSL